LSHLEVPSKPGRIPSRKLSDLPGFSSLNETRKAPGSLQNPAEYRCRGLTAKSTHSTLTLCRAGFARQGDEMSNLQTTPSIVPGDIPLLSDDECVLRLAQTVEDRDSDHLDELAQLIGRLAVTIE
jgi:hypothetical protein